MTTLERLAATTAPPWVEMIERYRAQSRTPAAARPTEWDRRGGSHYKDGVFTKK